jgi:hypothetical protein
LCGVNDRILAIGAINFASPKPINQNIIKNTHIYTKKIKSIRNKENKAYTLGVDAIDVAKCPTFPNICHSLPLYPANIRPQAIKLMKNIMVQDTKSASGKSIKLGDEVDAVDDAEPLLFENV